MNTIHMSVTRSTGFLRWVITILGISLWVMIPALPSRANEIDDVYESMYQSAAALGGQGYGAALSNVSDTQRLAPYMDKLTVAMGYAASLGSVSRKVGENNLSGATEEAMLVLLSEIAGWDSVGKAVLESVGLSAASFTLVLTAYTITKDSFAAVRTTKIALQVEELYGVILNDPVLHPKKGRKLGDISDPIPVNRKSLDYMYQRVISDSSFRDRLNAYVTQELNETFPEPSTLEWLSTALFSGMKNIDKLNKAKVVNNRKQVEIWIAGLLGRLNDYARAAENERLMIKAFKELLRARKKITPVYVDYTVHLDDAIQKLPEIRQFVQDVSVKISEIQNAKRWNDLYSLRDKIGYYTRVYVRVLPQSGSLGKTRKELKSALGNGWNAVHKVIDTIPQTVDQEFETAAAGAKYSTSIPLQKMPLNLKSTAEIVIAFEAAETVAAAEAVANQLKAEDKEVYAAFEAAFEIQNPLGGNHTQYKAAVSALPVVNPPTSCSGEWAYYQNTLSEDNTDQVRTAAKKSYEACSIAGAEKQDREFKIRTAAEAALNDSLNNYNRKRTLYQSEQRFIYNQHLSSIEAIHTARNQAIQDEENYKNELLKEFHTVAQNLNHSIPQCDRIEVNNNVAAVIRYLDDVQKAPSETYLGLPKFNFPTWNGTGAAVIQYLMNIQKNILNEKIQADNVVVSYENALACIHFQTENINSYQVFVQLYNELTSRLKALDIYGEADAEFILAAAKAIKNDVMLQKKLSKARNDIEKNLPKSVKTQLAIQEDMAYLNYVIRNAEFWQSMLSNDRVGIERPAQVTELRVATPGGAGNEKQSFLFRASIETGLLPKSEVKKIVDELLDSVTRTGISSWDSTGQTGLKSWVNEKAEEFKNYYVSSTDYAIVNANVVVASQVNEMTASVKAIPQSTYGTMTYRDGVQNRTFEEELTKSLQHGAGMAMNLVVSSLNNTADGRLKVSTGTLLKLAKSHPKKGFRNACNGLSKAIGAQLKNFHEKITADEKQYNLDKMKADAETTKMNNCLASGGRYVDGQCMAGGPPSGGPPSSGPPSSGPGTGGPPGNPPTGGYVPVNPNMPVSRPSF